MQEHAMHVPDIDLRFETQRLLIEPVKAEHAEIMVNVLSSPDLYQFIPLEPPSIDKLFARYKRWEPRISPNGDEIWLNWVIKLKSKDTYIGDFQVGYTSNLEAYIAYMIATPYQNKGYAKEGLQHIIHVLFNQLDIKSVKAWIDTRNTKSIALVESLGLRKIDYIEKADHFKGQYSDEFVFELKNSHD